MKRIIFAIIMVMVFCSGSQASNCVVKIEKWDGENSREYNLSYEPSDDLIIKLKTLRGVGWANKDQKYRIIIRKGKAFEWTEVEPYIISVLTDVYAQDGNVMRFEYGDSLKTSTVESTDTVTIPTQENTQTENTKFNPEKFRTTVTITYNALTLKEAAEKEQAFKSTFAKDACKVEIAVDKCIPSNPDNYITWESSLDTIMSGMPEVEYREF